MDDSPSSPLPRPLPVLPHLISMKMYYTATFTLLVYEHCLTFSAEIKFAWRPRKTFASVLFLLTRYLSLAFSTIALISYFSQAVTSSVCNRYVVAEIVFTILLFTVVEIFATLRTYAFTRKNKYIAAILALHVLSRHILGIVIILQRALTTARPLVPSDPDLLNPSAFQVCSLFPGANGDSLLFRLWMAYISIILSFNTIVFMTTLFMTVATFQTSPSQQWLQVMRRDGALYFVIFSATLIWFISAICLPDYLGIMNIMPTHIFTTVMINRIYFSLREEEQNIRPRKVSRVSMSESMKRVNDTLE